MKKLILFILLIPFISIAQVEIDSSETAENTLKKEIATAKKPKVEQQKEVCLSGDCDNGEGSMQYLSGTYVGEWKDGLRDGTGTYKWNNGDTYTGKWIKDKRHGQGTYVWSDGSRYKGNYSHGIRSGYGIYYYTNGSMYEGTWQNNLKHGIANFYYKESVNIGGRYVNNEYVGGTGITQGSYKHKPQMK